MDSDIKVTYTVIGILIVILGALAYFLQGNMNLPQVKVDSQATSTESFKKTTTSLIKTTKDIQSNSTTTMELPEKITSATITTNKGVIEITFTKDSPITVENFAKLLP